MRSWRSTSMKTTMVAGLALALMVSVAAQAQSPKPSAPAKDEKVDISDIENKYWAPKDTDFSVVQNRTYTKEHRLAFSALYGPIINEGFSEGNSSALAVNYFFSERYGIQLDYILSDYRDTDVVNDFQAFAGSGASPDYGRVKSYYGVGFNIVPFYAKMSLFGKKIMYFDMSITPTLGMTNYEALTYSMGGLDKSALTYGFDITQWYFLHRNFAIRADIRNRWFKEEVVKYRGTGEGQKIRTKNSDNMLILLGVTFFF